MVEFLKQLIMDVIAQTMKNWQVQLISRPLLRRFQIQHNQQHN